MKELKRFCYAFLACVAVMGFAACGGGDDEPGGGGGNGSTDPTPESPDKNYSEGTDPKDYVEDAASDVLNLMNAADQEPIADLFEYIYDKYADFDFEMPEKLENEFYKAPLRNMARVLARKDVMNYAPAVQNYTLGLSHISGIYEPNVRKEMWERVGDSKDCVLRFPYNSGKCVITVSGAGGNWVYTDVEQDSEWEYDEYTGQWDVFYYENRYKIEVPKKLTLTIVTGKETLVNATATTYYAANKQLQADIDATICNIRAVSETNIANNKGVETASVYVSDHRVAAGSSTITGSNLCNEELWMENDEFPTNVTGAEASISLNDQVQLKGKITDMRTFGKYIEYIDYVWDEYYYNNPEKKAKEVADNLNRSMNVGLYFAGSLDKERANVTLRPECNYYYWGDEWELVPLLNFPDGTSYEFKQYYDNNNFGRLERQFERLMRSYRNVFGF